MLTIVTWLWQSTGWRKGYGAQHVNTLEKMIKANLQLPHVFKCITDMPEGINCETIPLGENFDTNTPVNSPNCFRRLRAFAPEMRSVLGDRFVSIDLDCVILGDITPILDNQDPFKILQGMAAPYNGSIWMMNTGCRKEVYEHFNPQQSPAIANSQQMANKQKFHGSDQAWISYKIPGEKMWTKEDGIYQYVYDIKDKEIPANAKIIFFAGGLKPWSDKVFVDLHNEYHKYAA